MRHAPDEFLWLDSGPGDDVAQDSVFIQSNPDQTTTVLVPDAGRGTVWKSGAHQLAKLRFQLKNPAVKPVFHIRLADSIVERDGAPRAIKTLDAVVFGPDTVAR